MRIILQKMQKFLRYAKADLFRVVSFFLGNTPAGAYLRCFILTILGSRLGKRCRVFSGFNFLLNPGKLFLGDHVFINVNCFMDLTDKIQVDNNCLVGPNVNFITSTHRFAPKDFLLRPTQSLGPIFIEKNVFIGANSTIFGGVVVGENSVIGACSLVNKSIPPNSIAFGNPVKVFKSL